MGALSFFDALTRVRGRFRMCTHDIYSGLPDAPDYTPLRRSAEHINH